MSDNDQSSDLRVLHITNWYPTKSNPIDGIWIKRQIESLPSFVHSDVFHISVEFGKMAFLKSTIPGIRLRVPVKSWFLIELISFVLLLHFFLFRVNPRKYHVINFHIAYPLCVFLNIIRGLIRRPVVINEHWSAYHYNFGVQKPDRLFRIKALFRPDNRIITVSKALSNDIQKFVGNQNLTIDVVPNVVNTNEFKYGCQSREAFLMAGYWKYPKDPMRILKAFKQVREKFPDCILRVAGKGPLLPNMKSFVEESNLGNHVAWLGQLTESEMAMEMRQAIAFVHVSDYETFSVVCAEAICCGTPVIANAVGGVPEFINQSNGRLLTDKNIDSLALAMQYMLTNDHWDRMAISKEASQRFNRKQVGLLYYQSLIKSCEA